MAVLAALRRAHSVAPYTGKKTVTLTVRLVLATPPGVVTVRVVVAPSLKSTVPKAGSSASQPPAFVERKRETTTGCGGPDETSATVTVWLTFVGTPQRAALLDSKAADGHRSSDTVAPCCPSSRVRSTPMPAVWGDARSKVIE